MSLSDSRRIPPGLKQVGRSAVYTLTELGSQRRVLPSFLIVGGQRCGTTSLYRALSTHPATMRPILTKGVHYFDMDYTHDLAWYRSRFPTRWTARRRSRHAGAPAQAFESSPYYMFHPAAPERIAEDLPGVRLIVLVRDPVERAYSAWAHERARGFEQLDFEAALRAEDTRLAGQRDLLLADPAAESASHRHQAYRARGVYVDALDGLARHVDRPRIHVVDSHRFFEDPLPVYNEVLGFLGLPSASTPPFGRNNARERSPMRPETRAELAEFFRPHDERLAEWLGWKPSWLS